MSNIPNVPEEIKNYLMEAYQLAQQWKLPNGRGSFENAEASEIKNAAVIGGGTMGRGIAISLCLAGYQTVLVENNENALEWCRNELEITYEREKQYKRLNEAKIEKLRHAIKLTTKLEDCKNSDLVIEAVFEDMKLKLDLFSKLDKICKQSCIFGTNTSSLDIDKMSSSLQIPSKLVGIHFFNPANIIKMVEIVYGSNTSPNAVATAFEACKAMKKLPVLVGNCPAFVFNRLLSVYIAQTQKLLYQYGMLPKDVDRIVTSFGLLMGPLTMCDMNGLDVMEKLKKEHNYEFTPIEVELLKRKRYGRKSNKGYYKYDEQTHKKDNDMEVEEIIRKLSADSKYNIQLICDKDVLEFLFFPMINEGFLCIEEGMIHHESLIDIMFVLGFGWPAVHGGPMKYGRSVGITKVANTMSLWNSLEPNDRVYQIANTLKNLNDLQFSKI
ncbi:unnamed protein product [Caenorhabditis bovis]|uniref:Uncharacterized protein n=1 Tax=Caenorhabditis bovis TaxID=2654633 RepID=A0A8S1EI81_9PELO|nr:unnamed protein product [Caenorhabditis bovis]